MPDPDKRSRNKAKIAQNGERFRSPCIVLFDRFLEKMLRHIKNGGCVPIAVQDWQAGAQKLICL
jgi:hypothetical protein